MTNIKAIFFDADDTLYRIKGSYGKYYLNILNRNNLDCSESKINQVIYDTWSSLKDHYLNSSNQYITNEVQERNFWQEFVEKVCHTCELSVTPSICSEIYNEFATADGRILSAFALETIQELKKQKYKIGVLSNNDARILPILEGLKITPYLDYTYYSASIGFKKPSLECFELVRKATGLDADELLYVGNSYELDYLGAKNAGWQARLYTKNNDNYFATTISCLSELITDSVLSPSNQITTPGKTGTKGNCKH